MSIRPPTPPLKQYYQYPFERATELKRRLYGYKSPMAHLEAHQLHALYATERDGAPYEMTLRVNGRGRKCHADLNDGLFCITRGVLILLPQC